MKKYLFILVLISLSLISCGLIDNGPQTLEVAEIDLNNFAFYEKGVDISGNTKISVYNLDLSQGYYVSSFGVSGSGAKSKGKNSTSSGVMKTKTGDYLIVPDENNHSEFVGSDIGVFENSKLFVKKFENIETDFEITSEEHPNSGIDIFDEFYYVDFSKAPWNDGFDQSRVSIKRKTNMLIGEYKIVQSGCTNKLPDALYDLSGFDGFGVYAYVSKNDVGTDYDWSHKYYVINPQRMSTYAEKPVEVVRGVNSGTSIIDVDLPTGQYYKIIAQFDRIEDRRNLLEQINARYYNGEAREYEMIPVIEGNNTVVYYTGLLDAPFLFDVEMNTDSNLNLPDTDKITFTYELSDEEEYPGFFDLKDIPVGSEGYKILSKSESGYQTFAYKITQKEVYNVEWPENPEYPGSFKYALAMASRGKHSSGSGGWMNNNIDPDTSLTGHIVFECSNVGDTLITFYKTVPAYITCRHLKWDGEKYACQSDCGCGALYYYDDMFKYIQTSMRSITIADLGGDIGELGITQNGFYMLFNHPGFGIHVGGNSFDESGAFGSFSHSSENVNDSFLMKIDEIRTDENNMVSSLVVSGELKMTSLGLGTKTFNKVTFTARHFHDWDFSDDHIAVCSCGEQRSYFSRIIDPGVIHLKIQGLKNDDTVTIVQENADYSVVLGNIDSDFEPLQERALFYFVCSNPNCSITLSGGGTDYKIKASYK